MSDGDFIIVKRADSGSYIEGMTHTSDAAGNNAKNRTAQTHKIMRYEMLGI
jgi:hypothetical protein